MAAHDANARCGNVDAHCGIGSDYTVEANKWRRFNQ